MPATVQVKFRQVESRIRDEERGDEPYVWIFRAQIDGSTVVQNTDDTVMATVHVVSDGPSRANVASDHTIVSITGVIASTLRPIPIRIDNQRFFLPGLLVLVAVLMEEDSASNEAVDEGREAIRAKFEEVVHTFLTEVVNGKGFVSRVLHAAYASGAIAPATEELRAVTDRVLATAYLTALRERLDAMRDVLPTLAQAVIDSADATMVPLVDFFANPDPDDGVGCAVLIVDERVAFAVGGASHPFTLTLDDNGRAPHGRYLIHGSATVTAQVALTRTDVARRTFDRLKSGQHRFTDKEVRLCVKEGDVALWNGVDAFETTAFTCNNPFAKLRLEIDGIPIDETAQTVALTDKPVKHEVFDPLQPAGPAIVSTQRNVEVAVATTYDADRHQTLALSNRPSDGEYRFRVQVQTRLGPLVQDASSSNVQVLSAGASATEYTGLYDETLRFKGQFVVSDFFETVQSCMKKFLDLSDRLAKSKKPLTRGPASPIERVTWLEEQARVGEVLVGSRQTSRERMAAVLDAYSKRLNVTRPEPSA